MADALLNQNSVLDADHPAELEGSDYAESLTDDDYDSDDLWEQAQGDAEQRAAVLAAVAAYAQQKCGKTTLDLSEYEDLSTEELYAILIEIREYAQEQVRYWKAIAEGVSDTEVDKEISAMSSWIGESQIELQQLKVTNQEVVFNIEQQFSAISARLQQEIQQEYAEYQVNQERLLATVVEVTAEIEEERTEIIEIQQEFQELEHEFKAKQTEIMAICCQIVTLRAKIVADLELMLGAINRQELSVETAEQKMEEVAQELAVKYQNIEQEYQNQIKQIISTYEAQMAAFAKGAARRSKRKAFTRGLFVIAAGALAAVTAGALAPVLLPSLFPTMVVAGKVTFTLAAKIALGAVAGASFGATSAAITHGNVLKETLTGGVLGGVGGAMEAVAVAKMSSVAARAPRLAAIYEGAIVGGGVGATSTLLQGGKLLDNALLSAISGGVSRGVVPPVINEGSLNNVARSVVGATVSAVVRNEKLENCLTAGLIGAVQGVAQSGGNLAGEHLITAVTTNLGAGTDKTGGSMTAVVPGKRSDKDSGSNRTRERSSSSDTHGSNGQNGPALIFHNGFRGGDGNTAVGSQFNPRFRNVPTDAYAGKGTLEVVKLAVRGDKGAKQEMTRRMPRTAAYSNAVKAVNEEWRVGTRAMGGLQCAGGASQVVFSVAGGLLSSETVIGSVLAAGYATIGVDNTMTGARIFWTGRSEHTALNQVLRSSGAGENTAMWLEMGLNLGPSLPGMAREAGNVLQGPISKLYDLRNGTMLTQRGVAATREFTAMHDFRSPVVFQFGSGRAEGVTFMHSGIKPPVDIKLRSPVVSSPNLNVSGTTTLSRAQQVTFRRTDDLLGIEPASQELIEAVRNKGRIVEIVKPGTDEYRYMQLHGWEANVGGENLTHILVRENPSKAALLEEFLHGTQAKTGVLERFSLKHGGDASAAGLEAEAHIKKFMIRHKDLLKLHHEDVNILEQLYEVECGRLNFTLQRRFK